MKRFISFCLVFIICISCVPCWAFAQRDVTYEEKLAYELRELGLFKGVSDTDFDLARAPSRVEAVVMLIRVLGRENEVASGVWRHPFTDVPEWANKYVGFAYSNGLTNGQSLSEFGTGDANAAMFITFVLRALGYSDASGGDFVWNDPFTLARTVGIIPENVNLSQFWRSDVVLVAHTALSAKLKGSDKTLAGRLIEQGIFTKKKFDSCYGVYSKGKAPAHEGRELSAEQIYAACSPAVFYIELYDGAGNATGSGSGFFIDDKGTAITNHHVIEGASSAKIQMSDSGDVYDITGIYDYSKENDWALIQVDCTGNKYLTVGDDSTIVGGATVYAIGSPLGLQNTISQGLISNPKREVGKTTYIQISAAISQGSSGGALINKYGEVIGITSAGADEGQNLNLALPMSYPEKGSCEELYSFAQVNKNVTLQSPDRTTKAYSLLASLITGSYSSESSLGKAFEIPTPSSDEKYTVYYNENDGSVAVNISIALDGTTHCTFYMRLHPGKNTAYTKYTYKIYNDLNLKTSAEGSADIVCASFGGYADYSFSQYTGSLALRSDHKKVAGAMMCSAIDAINGIFDEYLRTPENYNACDLGFTSYSNG